MLSAAYTLGEIIDDVRNKDRIQTVIVRTITAEDVFICLSFAATLLLMLEQVCGDNEDVPVPRFLKIDTKSMFILSIYIFFIDIKHPHHYL